MINTQSLTLGMALSAYQKKTKQIKYPHCSLYHRYPTFGNTFIYEMNSNMPVINRHIWRIWIFSSIFEEWRIWIFFFFFFCFLHKHFAGNVMVSEQLEFLEQNCNIWDRSLILKTTNLGIWTWKSKRELSPELLKLRLLYPSENWRARERVLVTIWQACHIFLEHFFLLQIWKKNKLFQINKFRYIMGVEYKRDMHF